MEKIKADIIIIGAGLAGLSLAYYLRKRDIHVIIVEARSRIGGRIYTHQDEGQAPLEMGATWVHSHHHATLRLLEELEASVFEQQFGTTAIYELNSEMPAQLVSMPPNGNPTYRIADGSFSMIKRLSSNIKEENIYLDQAIVSIEEKEHSIIAQSENILFEGQMIVSTLPPFLFVNKIKVQPSLPQDLLDVCQRTRTWMGESIKVALTFKERFWKNSNGVGTMFSKVGPMIELYDHSDASDSTFALKGFIRNDFYQLSPSERQEQVLRQMEKFYGPQIRSYLSYEELVWKDEIFTATEMTDLMEPQSNFGHAVYQKSYLNDRFYMAGTETSRREAGFMEGAVLSAQSMVQHILKGGTKFSS